MRAEADTNDTVLEAEDGRETRVYAVSNQKGGVGKTTTAINLGTALASIGRRVLIIDFDPQGNASTGLGIDAHERQRATYHLLHREVTLRDAAAPAKMVANLFVVPSTVDLSGVDAELMSEEDGRYRLRDALFQDQDGRSAVAALGVDYVLIDCPPSLNLLTVNAMAAAHGVIVPLQCEFFALEGLTQLLKTIQRIRRNMNPSLGIQGVILTMYDKRHRSCAEVAETARSELGDLVYETVVPRNVKIAEAPSHGLPALMYDPGSHGSQAYVQLATEFLERENDYV